MTARGGRLLIGLALLSALALALTYVVALHTAWGVYHDRVLFEGVSGYVSLPVRAAGERALRTIDIGSILVVLAVLVFAVTRGRFARAGAALGMIGCSIGTTELLKHGLPHVGGIPAGRLPTFPSGNASLAVALGLGLVLAVPPVVRVTAALVGAAYGAGIALSVVVLGWHYPSDVVASFFVCGFWASLFARLLHAEPRRRRLSLSSALMAVAATSISLLVAIVVAERHRAAVESIGTRRAIVETAALLAVLSLVLFAVATLLVEEREVA